MRLVGKLPLLYACLISAGAGAVPVHPAPRAGDDPIVEDERSLAYRHDAELGWFPKADNRVTYTGSRTIHIAHNAMGFRDREHTLEKTRPRLVFVGDSFVWGYDVEAKERFTEQVQAAFDTIEVLNLGVSGYGTDQSYLLLQKFWDDYDPNAVIYMFSETDVEDNAVNFNYGAYYKPYYVLGEAGLELRGVPVPRSSIWSRLKSMVGLHRRPRAENGAEITTHLITAMRRFVRSKGASFAVGLIDEHPVVRPHLTKERIPFFDLTHVDQRYRYPGHGFHWTPEGHRLVARAVQAFLIHNGLASTSRPAVPEKVVVLTFDDGARSHFTVVRPLLKELGFSATFFITEGFDFATNKRDYMTWKQIRQLHQDGFEIGNHTRDHLEVTPRNLSRLRDQIEAINEKCMKHGIPRPVSFAYPGNTFDLGALPILEGAGFKFARRGGSPEYPYGEGKGVAYSPGEDHPLLIPSTGDARERWTPEDFEGALERASGRGIPVLQFHGVPDSAHPWVSTPRRRFEEYMRLLKERGYRAIALRDLEPFLESSATPTDPGAIIGERLRRTRWKVQ
jgi:peptidoglycan/xylan/chitin deacetylase (PgdA/CDA1 family)